MTRRAWLPHVAAVLGYVCVAVAFSWPLVPNLGTHLTGDPGGDTGVYVWNQWVFRHSALVEQRNPLTTEHIFSLTGRPVDLTQHNYTLFLNALAFPLSQWLGTVATFNVVMLLMVVLTAWVTYRLALRVTDGARVESWLAGLAFAWAPVLVARTTGHVSLVAAAPLAAFLWCLHRVERSQRLSDSVLAGLAMAWAAFCDAYFAVYCVMIALLYVGSRLLRLEWRPQWKHGVGLWMLDLALVLAAGLVVGLAAGQGGRFDILGIPVSIRGLYTPVLLLTILIVARVGTALRPRVAVLGPPAPRSLRTVAVAVVVGAAALSPVLYSVVTRILDGTWVSPPLLWRSSPRGVDLLALVTPNPSHPAVTALVGSWQLDAPVDFVEYTASLSLVSLAVVGWAMWRATFRPRGWFVLTLLFAGCALGPFITVGGVNTYVPGPWALLRYAPIVGMARTPTRFAIVAALGLSVLLALALRALGERYPSKRRALLAAVSVLLAAELLPSPRPLYAARVPDVYGIIRDDPRPVRILELPFGVRDGVTSEGNFTARYQFHQTVHRKPLMGGYLSRVSERRFREVRSSRTLSGLLALSEGRTLPPDELDTLAARGPGFVERANLGWVVIHPSTAPPGLVDFAHRAFDLELVATGEDAQLYRPRRRGAPVDVAVER